MIIIIVIIIIFIITIIITILLLLLTTYLLLQYHKILQTVLGQKKVIKANYRYSGMEFSKDTF